MYFPAMSNLRWIHFSEAMMHPWASLGDSLFQSDEQPELNFENDCPNKTGHNLTLSGPAFSVVRQARPFQLFARPEGGLRGPDAKNQS